ncbi:LysR family transcriptional regulator [Psychrosphaera sp. 1_MG-2023]|uniref:LysR family transcriptional regulator n=1 Tax=Psychrosphaera algicola TaxID=3023714 RepID=A0ABT5F8R1_9GAMM|nr:MULTISPECIES: LysR family transcriptional regulator [unclassified Psychrosphaera]MDC2887918.1 LysR family transcriptional regulator [Psychrosphaera sp. G1-22]MDO6718027.1 LysR family transcriptional regulator [Psychrosphaera sp. 1_MG-2023]
MDRVKAAQVFIDVARTGSFTATSERLEMSRPMVTRYIEVMESWLEVRLLHRTTRKVTLTTQGEKCLNDIEQWLTTADQFISEIKSTEQLSGRIRLACSMSFSHAQLMVAIQQFMTRHPKVSIDIDLQDTAIDLVDSRIDLAIRIASNPDPSLIGKPLAVCHSVLVASQAYLDSMPAITAPDDLSQHRCLSYTNFEKHIWHLWNENEHKAISVNCQLTANEATTLLKAAQCGAGISMQPTYMANAAIENGSLVRVLPNWNTNDMNIYALYSSRKFLSPTVRALIDFLAEYFKQHPWD